MEIINRKVGINDLEDNHLKIWFLKIMIEMDTSPLSNSRKGKNMNVQNKW